MKYFSFKNVLALCVFVPELVPDMCVFTFLFLLVISQVTRNSTTEKTVLLREIVCDMI